MKKILVYISQKGYKNSYVMFIQKRNQHFFPPVVFFYIRKEFAVPYVAGDHFYASENMKMSLQVTSLNSAFKV